MMAQGNIIIKLFAIVIALASSACIGSKKLLQSPVYYYSNECRLFFKLYDSTYEFTYTGITYDVLCQGQFKIQSDTIVFTASASSLKSDTTTFSIDSLGAPLNTQYTIQKVKFCEPVEIGIIKKDTIYFHSCIFIKK